MTVYNNLIPQPNDRPSNSQNQLLNNFKAIKTYVDRNHVAIVDPTTNLGEGKHKFLQMPEQSAAPTVAVNEGGLYVKEKDSRATLFYRQENNGTEIQMTRMNPTLSTVGETFLPGGVILKWGTANFSGTICTVMFLSNFVTLYQVVATLTNTGTSTNETLDREFHIEQTGISGFKAYIKNLVKSPQVASCSWFAIGV